jgi:hypothetical protein
MRVISLVVRVAARGVVGERRVQSEARPRGLVNGTPVTLPA